MTTTRFCIFGLGEAGSAIASDLVAAGAEVFAFDPAPLTTPAGIVRLDDPRVAVAGASVILAVTAAADSATALEQAIDEIPAGALYADLATSASDRKRSLAALAAGHGHLFADVALMGTVAGLGLSTPALASGPGADRFADEMARWGMPVEVVGERPGRAAEHKLVRSVVIKGLAAALIESMHAANALGMAEVTWNDLVSQLNRIDEAFLRRLVEGSETHAIRRVAEMSAVIDLLENCGVEPIMARATMTQLQTLVQGGPPPPSAPARSATDQS